MVNNDWLCEKIVRDLLHYGTYLGLGRRVGGQDIVPSFALAELYDEMTHVVTEFWIFQQLYGRPKFSPHFENVLIPY